MTTMTYRQTEGGNYDSRPLAEDVLDVLRGGQGEWAGRAAARGHGEYIENVYAVAEMFRGIAPYIEQVEQYIAALVPEYV